MSDTNKNAGQPEKQTPTANSGETPQEPNPVQPEEAEVLDNNDYQPDFVVRWLENPPVLPGERKEEFVAIFESLEYDTFSIGRPKTDAEYFLVWQATTIMWELKRWNEIKLKIIGSQGRPGAESVFRRALHVMAPDEDIEDPKATVREFGRRYFSSQDIQTIYDERLKGAGYGAGAIEAEVFLRSLAPLATIDKTIALLERRLFNIRKQLDNAYASRDPEEEMPESPAAKRFNEKSK